MDTPAMNLLVMNHPSRPAFHEVWYLKLNDPASQRALWIRFTLLSSGNGFKRVAEAWAVYFHRDENREVKKVALKQTFDLGAFKASPKNTVLKIGENELTSTSTQGFVQSKGNSIRWDLSFSPERSCHFNLIPEFFSKIGLNQTSAETLCEELIFTGMTEINGEVIHWKESPGMIGHFYGPKSGHSWTWGQCNSFKNESGNPVPFVFEGLSVRAQVGPLKSPLISTFYFYYQGRNYHFNSLKDVIQLKSKNTLNEWQFQADRGDIVFRGYVKSDYKDFAGLTYEDTNGSLLYCANSKLSNMKVLVYKRGKLESSFSSEGTAAFEVVSRDKNPYVPILV
jgi:hypothetical protein